MKENVKSKSKRGGARLGAGRRFGPGKFKTVGELEKQIQAYFDDCDPHWEWAGIYREKKADDGNPLVVRGRMQYVHVKVMAKTPQKDYTVSGLCLWLNTSRDVILDYEKGKYGDEYSNTIKRAKCAIENYTELKSLGPNPTGAIFNLKNNWGWKDKQEVEHSGEINRNASDEELDAIIARAESRKAGQSS